MTPTLSAVCELCHGEKRVPDPEWTGEMMRCPLCAEDDGPEPDDAPYGGAAALPIRPSETVWPVEIWAVSADESRVELIPLSFPKSSALIAVTTAKVAAQNRAKNPAFRGGEIRVCDAVGQVYGRVPIRAA